MVHAGPFDSLLGLSTGLVKLLLDMRREPALQEHARQLQEDAALCSGLTALLVPALSKAVVMQRLPADRQEEGFTWSTPASLAGILAVTLRPGLQQHLAAADNAALLRLLRTAAAAASEDRPAGLEPAAVLWSHADAAGLLGLVAECAAQRPCRQQAASALLAAPLLRQLGSALQAAPAAAQAGDGGGPPGPRRCQGGAAGLGRLQARPLAQP